MTCAVLGTEINTLLVVAVLVLSGYGPKVARRRKKRKTMPSEDPPRAPKVKSLPKRSRGGVHRRRDNQKPFQNAFRSALRPPVLNNVATSPNATEVRLHRTTPWPTSL